MPEATAISALWSQCQSTAKGTYMTLLRLEPAKLLLLGYLSYIVIGWILLSLPFAQEHAVGALDNLFMASSAVSTTGLITVDTGGSYTFFGELVLLLLIQFGGLGYMTIGSFAILALHNSLSGIHEKSAKAAFNLPDDIKPSAFVLSVVVFTLICEIIGSTALYFMFASAGVDNALWSAIFHAISAFCTAGFSLFSNSFEDFSNHAGINIVISILSILGAMGFLIVVDAWRTLTAQKRRLGFTSTIIMRMTVLLIVGASLILFVVEPSLQTLEPRERFLGAMFQAMTASTTVGFNTMPLSAFSMSALVIFFLLMAVGASPAGTGGGLKTTNLAALIGLVRSSLRNRKKVVYLDRKVPDNKVKTASASLTFYLAVLIISLFLLGLTEPGHAFEVIMFEAMSALGTVGLSMGLTGELSDLGKLIIIVLMTAGRVGILTFGIALATSETRAKASKEDDELVVE